MTLQEQIAELVSYHCEESEGCEGKDCSQCKPMLTTASEILSRVRQSIEGINEWPNMAKLMQIENPGHIFLSAKTWNSLKGGTE